MSSSILVVDDQQSFRFVLEKQLRNMGFSVTTASSAEEALSLLRRQSVDLILSDMVMPGIDGLAFLSLVRETWSTIPFIVITSHGTVASAVEALKLGAFDYVEKHCSTDELKITLARALDYQALLSENEQLKQHLNQEYSFHNIVTGCPTMRHVLEMAANVATAPRTTVALFGESGCGKEVLARAIHFSSGGMPGNFVGINCAAIPETLLENELFGHVRGAFTGADRDREGKISQARSGTLLLDEIGDMPLDVQAKLLRLLEDRVFEKIGSNQPVNVDCRIIVATNHNLHSLVEAGRFRRDLYHRINVFPLTIPPLRDRRQDIVILVDHFLKKLRNHLGKSLPGISQSAMNRLLAYDWPGNVRELRNCLERAAILVPEGALILPEHFSMGSDQAPGNPAPSDDGTAGNGELEYRFFFTPDDISLDAINQRVLDITLEHCAGNKTKAAALLKISRNTFYYHRAKQVIAC